MAKKTFEQHEAVEGSDENNKRDKVPDAFQSFIALTGADIGLNAKDCRSLTFEKLMEIVVRTREEIQIESECKKFGLNDEEIVRLLEDPKAQTDFVSFFLAMGTLGPEDANDFTFETLIKSINKKLHSTDTWHQFIN